VKKSSKRSRARPVRTPQDRGLSPRERDALTAIRRFWQEHGISPSRAELAQMLGLKTTSGTDGLIRGLALRGRIEIVPGVSRGIRIVDLDEVPVIKVSGNIRHEEPLFDKRWIRDHVPGILVKGLSVRPDYYLMMEEPDMDEIAREGDLVAVREVRHADSGTVIVGRVDGEVRCKRYNRIDRQFVELQPMSSDPNHQPMRIDLLKHDFQIDGIVLGSIATRPMPYPP